MTRTRIALSTLGLAAVVGLSACATAPAPDVADEALALREVGLESGLAEAPAPSPSASAADGKRRDRAPGARRHLRKNTLHGEITVQGKDGVRTVVVQRGAVTAVDGRSVSVKSADGYAVTWTLGDKVRVRQDKKKADAAAVKVGAQVGLAGAKEGETTTARLVLIQP
jgi:hypothetical protein